MTGVIVGSLMWVREGVMGKQDDVHTKSFCTSVLKILVYQSCRRWPSWSGTRMISSTIMFLAVVVGSLYSGSITAFLAIPFRSQPINSLDELLETQVIPAIRRLSSPYSFFLTENSGMVGKKVREVMAVFSGTEVSSWNFLKEVAQGSFGLIDTASSGIGSSGQYEKLGTPCLFHVGRNPVRMDLDAFAYPKNCPVKYQFDEM
ncbi:uncharacterized protein LOC121875381 [Homarus americanus]|uniref:uncharacterized protein LOC121875381 n=1 Tax=Homarus americanus TaxID=6706 RepID=UPI001C45DC89|nr:uncharacterized protein LOC121875381 [Homarus americanus]